MKKEKAVEVDFEPLWDYVLVKPEIADTTEGGLHLPDNVKLNDVQKSLVVAAGPGMFRDGGGFVPNPIQVGDYIWHLARVKPYQIKLGGVLYLCMAARDIVAITKRKVDETQN